MFKDYFMQMLAAAVLQMVHKPGPNFAYSLQHIGGYLTNKFFNIGFQHINRCGLVAINMSLNIAPQEIV